MTRVRKIVMNCDKLRQAHIHPQRLHPPGRTLRQSQPPDGQQQVWSSITS